MNPYEILGLKEGASQEEIKNAYREQVKKYHPDKFNDNPLQDLAEEKLREINEAYETLTKNPGFKAGKSSANPGHAGAGMNAEWYYQEGVKAYQRGKVDEAFRYVQTACSMEPNNLMYRQTLSQMSVRGQQFTGGAYNRGYGNNNDMCQICGTLWCMDSCCECCGGDILSCC